VREDIASCELATLASDVDMDDLVNAYGYPEFLTRVILRLLMVKGISTKEGIGMYQGRKVITLANLKNYKNDPELAQHVGKYHRPMLDEITRRLALQARELPSSA
jgi:hypothetical protein